MDNFTTTTYTRDGNVETVLSASKMVHFPDDDSTDLTLPRVLQAKPDQPRYTARADRGKVSREGDEIFLYDNVVLVREADAAHPQGAPDDVVPAHPARPQPRAHRPRSAIRGARAAG